MKAINLIIVLALSTVSLWAQGGQMQGVIRDASGAPVGGAEIKIANTEINDERTVTSALDGTYKVSDLPAGTYRIEVSRTGFFSAYQSEVAVQAGATATADISMGWNPAHIHLILNHLPTVGFGVALALFFVALAGKSNDLKRASLVMFFIMALLVIPIYASGNAAEQSLAANKPEISKSAVEAHEDAALLAFLFMELTGLFSWIALWQYRRKSVAARSGLLAVLVLAIVTFGLMGRAATLGGEVQHAEIRSALEPEETASTAWIQTESIAAASRDNPWLWPAAETIHFIGLAVLFGIVLVVNLRMLGVMRNVSFSALHSLLPVGIAAFGANIITGMFFFVATPEQYTQNIAFYWKVAFMLVGGANLFYLTVFDDAWVLGSGDEAPTRSKVVAASGILIWVCVIYLGRMLPFIGNSF